MNSPKVLVDEHEENKTFNIRKSLQKFCCIVMGVTNSIEEQITRVVRSINSLALIDICLIGENSTQIEYISRDHSSVSTLYLTDDSENTKIICLSFQTIYFLKKTYTWLPKWLSKSNKYPKDCNRKSNTQVW